MSVPTHALQEEQDHQRDQDERLDDLLLEAMIGGAHEGRLIENRNDLHARWQNL